MRNADAEESREGETAGDRLITWERRISQRFRTRLSGTESDLKIEIERESETEIQRDREKEGETDTM